MKKGILTVVYLFLMLFSTGCWVGYKDRSLTRDALNISSGKTLESRIYVTCSFPGKTDRSIVAVYNRLFKEEMKEAQKRCKCFKLVEKRDSCDYVFDYSITTIDKSLVALAGMGIIPVNGNIYNVFELKVKTKSGEVIKTYYQIFKSGLIPHFAFLPLLMTPFPYRVMKVSSYWDKMFTLFMKDIAEEKIIN